MTTPFVYITKESMFHFENDEVQEIHSQYLENYKKNASQIQKKKEWKRHSDLTMMGAPSHMIPAVEDHLIHEFHGCTFYDKEFLYAVQIENSAGLFRTRPALEKDSEGHLIHNTNKRYSAPCFSSIYRELVYSTLESDGTENLHMVHMDSEEELELTEGDSRDSNPSWDLSGSRAIVYQSTGIGRDMHGQFRLLGPSEINILDLEDEEVLEVASNPAFDYITPIMFEGNVYAIRRPYEGNRHKNIGPLALLMIPLNILKTLFSWINFNSMIFRGKPLIEGDQQAKNDDIHRKLLLHGNLVDAHKAIEASKKRGDAVPALVPSNWKLVKITPDGEETEIEESVLAFNYSTDGTLIYSNGSAIFEKKDGEKRNLIRKEKYVQRIVTPR